MCGFTLGEESGAGTCEAELGGVELRCLWTGDVEGDPEDLDGAGGANVDGGRGPVGAVDCKGGRGRGWVRGVEEGDSEFVRGDLEVEEEGEGRDRVALALDAAEGGDR